MATIKPEYLTVRDAAAYLSASVPSVYRWIAEGSLRAYKMNGRSVRIRVDDLEYFLQPVPVAA